MDTKLVPVLFGIEFDGVLLPETFKSQDAADTEKLNRDQADVKLGRGTAVRKVVPLARLDQLPAPRPTLAALKRFWDAHVQHLNVARGTLDALDALIRADERALTEQRLAATNAKLDAATKFARAYFALRAACGHVENGTSRSVRVHQDDATRTWVVTAGTQDAFSEVDLADALLAFNTKHPPEE